MNPVTIHKTIEIAAPPAQVWPRIGSGAGLSKWWGVDIDMEERAGGHFAESGLHNGHPYRQIGEIVIYDPPRQLLIRLCNLGAGIEWPIHTEVDITLEEKVGEENEPRTRLSIVHRAFTDETDAIAMDSLVPIYPNANTYGPTMELPQRTDSVVQSSTTAISHSTQTKPLTLEQLYQWKHQQEERWQRYCIMLANASN